MCMCLMLWGQVALLGIAAVHGLAQDSKAPLTHAPMRPYPTVSTRPMSAGTGRFVDAQRGDDSHAGSPEAPWRTLQFALRQLRPGETLYLRGGVYREHVSLLRSGTAEAPITIRSYPGEQAIIDGGLREFLENPEAAWEPAPDGAAGEFISTRTYFDFDRRQVPHQFLPGCWEPMYGLEEERPMVLGHFADSMVPLHSYRSLNDLRSANELWTGNKHEMRIAGIYCGPGAWLNRETGRIHIRLARHQLAGLGSRAYRGETDPRKVPLVLSVGFGDDVVTLNGVQHVTLQDLVFRGATGSPMLHIYGSSDIHLDHCTIYGGFPALLVNATKNLKVTHSACRGLAAPWTSRAHMKYRGTASYQIVLQNNQPLNENIEFAWCEFTDDHDFAFLRYARNLQFHHNFVENFNDDGLECGPKLRDHTIFISQNRISRCLIPLTQHELYKDESPIDHDAGCGVYLYRNVFDQRGGVYGSPPAELDSTGAYLRQEGHLASDHGSPTWPVLYAYHNTLVRDTPVFRDAYLFGLGVSGMKNTERDVFNNIFVQSDRLPGVAFVGLKDAPRVREGGNLIWGYQGGPALQTDPFAKFRASPLFASSQLQYPAGWTTHDFVADPGFVRSPADSSRPCDLRLQPDSAAIDRGQPLPEDWPDPLRSRDAGAPDIGAVPFGVTPDGIGVDGRLSLFGN